MSFTRQYGDAVAHALGLADVPALQARALRQSDIAIGRRCGAKVVAQSGRDTPSMAAGRSSRVITSLAAGPLCLRQPIRSGSDSFNKSKLRVIESIFRR